MGPPPCFPVFHAGFGLAHISFDDQGSGVPRRSLSNLTGRCRAQGRALAAERKRGGIPIGPPPCFPVFHAGFGLPHNSLDDQGADEPSPSVARELARLAANESYWARPAAVFAIRRSPPPVAAGGMSDGGTPNGGHANA